MSENFEPKLEKRSRETATEFYLKGLNPELWEKVSSLSTEERDQYWFDLTQKHLKDHNAGKFETEEFKLEELEFLYLNHLTAREISALDSEMPQRGFSFTPEQGMKRFDKFGNFIESIKKEAEESIEKTSKPFQILVSGIGISGKATLRNVLTKELAEKLPQKKIISWDRDYQKIFPPPWQADVSVIEDVHGLDKGLERFDGKEGLPGGYDLVVYCLSPKKTYRQTLFERGKAWIEAGKIDLTAPEKEAPVQLKERVKETATELERTLRVGKDWFKEHFAVLRGLKKRGAKIAVVDPTRIFKELYHFEEQPELLDKSFLGALERHFEK